MSMRTIGSSGAQRRAHLAPGWLPFPWRAAPLALPATPRSRRHGEGSWGPLSHMGISPSLPHRLAVAGKLIGRVVSACRSSRRIERRYEPEQRARRPARRPETSIARLLQSPAGLCSDPAKLSVSAHAMLAERERRRQPTHQRTDRRRQARVRLAMMATAGLYETFRRLALQAEGRVD